MLTRAKTKGLDLIINFSLLLNKGARYERYIASLGRCFFYQDQI